MQWLLVMLLPRYGHLTRVGGRGIVIAFSLGTVECVKKCVYLRCLSMRLFYIHFECAIRQLQPDSIKNVYLAGISDYFDRNCVINMFREAQTTIVFSSY